MNLVDGPVVEHFQRFNHHAVLLIQRDRSILDNQFEGWHSHLCDGAGYVVIGVYAPIIVRLDFAFVDGLYLLVREKVSNVGSDSSSIAAIVTIFGVRIFEVVTS
jgi:hypothetical protein